MVWTDPAHDTDLRRAVAEASMNLLVIQNAGKLSIEFPQKDFSCMRLVMWCNIFGSGTVSLASRHADPGSIVGQSLWDSWWTEWKRDRFSSKYISCPSLSFHCPSIFRRMGNGPTRVAYPRIPATALQQHKTVWMAQYHKQACSFLML
jgi:hypothetical protein